MRSHVASLLLTVFMFGTLPTLAQESTDRESALEQPAANSAQQSPNAEAPTASASPTNKQSSEEEKEKQHEEQTGTSNDRLFYALPNFLSLDQEGTYPPLSTGEKFKVVARGSFDWVEFAWIGAQAGVGQARDSEPEYGQGASGYFKRFGSDFGDSVIENFMVGAVLPSALHQDPRYYVMGKGGFWRRVKYAASRIVITRSDSGQKEFNFSEIFGSGAAAAISTYTYHPKPERTFGDLGEVWGTQVGLDGATIVVREFWPDIRRKLHRGS